MKINIKISILVVALFIVLACFKLSYAFGWLVGVVVMSILNSTRPQFYDKLLSQDKLSVPLYVSYVIFTVGLIVIPGLVAFLFPDIINPYTVFLAYFGERLRKFVIGIFEKKELAGEE